MCVGGGGAYILLGFAVLFKQGYSFYNIQKFFNQAFKNISNSKITVNPRSFLGGKGIIHFTTELPLT